MIQSLCYKHTSDIGMEDTRTSAIIGTLLHLPDDLLWNILRSSCSFSENLPEYLGNLLSYDFWPNWDPTGTENVNKVEPDVFMRFENADVIIEAKQNDSALQYPEQWTRELRAYCNQYGTESTKVVFIALGGNAMEIKPNTISIDTNAFTIHKCSWFNLMQRIHSERDKQNSQTRRTLDDAILFFDLIGVKNYRFLSMRPWMADWSIEYEGGCLNG